MLNAITLHSDKVGMAVATEALTLPALIDREGDAGLAQVASKQPASWPERLLLPPELPNRGEKNKAKPGNPVWSAAPVVTYSTPVADGAKPELTNVYVAPVRELPVVVVMLTAENVLASASYVNEPDAVPPSPKVTPFKVQTRAVADAETETTLNAMTANRIPSKRNRILFSLDVHEWSAIAGSENINHEDDFLQVFLQTNTAGRPFSKESKVDPRPESKSVLPHQTPECN